MSGDSIRGAIIDIDSAARHMAMAAGDNFEAPDKSHWFKLGFQSLTEGLGILGFDLVPRKTPADLHSEAIAARAAEEPAAVTSEPCWDGRDNTSIEDIEWSR